MSCFICLKDIKNRVCDTCQTYACKGCWTHYIRNKNPVFSHIFMINNHVNTFLRYLTTVECPVCKKKLQARQFITRSKMREHRKVYYSIVMDGYTNAINTSERLDDIVEIIKNMFKFMVENKNCIDINEPDVANALIKLLQRVKKHWKDAPYYMFKLFGTSDLGCI